MLSSEENPRSLPLTDSRISANFTEKTGQCTSSSTRLVLGSSSSAVLALDHFPVSRRVSVVLQMHLILRSPLASTSKSMRPCGHHRALLYFNAEAAAAFHQPNDHHSECRKKCICHQANSCISHLRSLHPTHGQSQQCSDHCLLHR